MKILLFILFVHIEQYNTEDMRSLKMSSMKGWQFQCATTTCLPFNTLTTSNIRRCQMACLAQTQCEAATFQQSTLTCQLFSNIQSQLGNMLANVDTMTMIVKFGTRIPAG